MLVNASPASLVPELPEVERAVRILRECAVGRTIGRVRLLHPALTRRLSPARRRALRQARVVRVERRGKHQLLWLDDGRVLHVHFRMTGDWSVSDGGAPLPRYARASIEFTDGTRLVLEDPRALATLDVHPADAVPDLALGPEPGDPALTPARLHASLASRRGAIKPVLLDQRVIAGLGNIYAAEALWRARLDPRAPAASLRPRDIERLLRAIRSVIERATGARYRDTAAARLDVYGREGQPCRRCGTALARIVQAGRSTYLCPRCQRAPVSRAPRRVRP